MGAIPSGARLGSEPSAESVPEVASAYVEVINQSGVPLHLSHTEPEDCAATLPKILESHALLHFPVSDEVFISYVIRAPDDESGHLRPVPMLHFYATLQVVGLHGALLGDQLLFAARLGGDRDTLRQLASRHGHQGPCSWQGRWRPRRTRFTLEPMEQLSEKRTARRKFLEDLEQREAAVPSKAVECVDDAASEKSCEVPSLEVRDTVDKVEVEIPPKAVPRTPQREALPEPVAPPIQVSAAAKRTRSGMVAVEAQRALKIQREKLEQERREEELEREMKANCSALIAMQDNEYHRSLLHDELQDLRKELQSCEDAQKQVEVDLEKTVKQWDHANSRLTRYGDNPRLRSEMTSAAEAKEKLVARLDETLKRQEEVKEMISEKEELLCMAALAEGPEN